MTFDNAYKKFLLISGMSHEDASPWLSVLKEAMSYVESLVTKQKLSECDFTRLENAAAVYAYYRYVSYSSGEESSFSAGDLSVTFNKEKIEVAKKMWKTELDSLNDLVSSGFIFKRVN